MTGRSSCAPRLVRRRSLPNAVLQSLMPTAGLRAAIHDLVEDLTDHVLEAVRRASTAHVKKTGPLKKTGHLQKNSAAKPRRGAPRARPVAPRAHKREVRSAVADDADVKFDAMLDLLKQAPKGVRSEALREALSVEKIPFRALVKAGFDTGLIYSTGERRSTTFFAT
ncbi:hypothetical protein LZC95_49355 [Pendulispora brunnea]|uniref:Uncharacterized protein n=1 Tax=Pendulispora brunnea TaxID=2905690 RepID=A0ABZ2K6X9_9BACT